MLKAPATVASQVPWRPPADPLVGVRTRYQRSGRERSAELSARICRMVEESRVDAPRSERVCELLQFLLPSLWLP
jgi:hypothetical protein